jgi:hypothetical protein
MKAKDIRLTWDSGERYKVCEHNSINAKENDDNFPACEYEVALSIYCNKCKKVYDFSIKVN